MVPDPHQPESGAEPASGFWISSVTSRPGSRAVLSSVVIGRDKLSFTFSHLSDFLQGIEVRDVILIVVEQRGGERGMAAEVGTGSEESGLSGRSRGQRSEVIAVDWRLCQELSRSGLIILM